MSGAGSLWTAEQPLVLASGSAARRALLEAAAVPVVVVPAEVDERAVEAPLRLAGASAAVIAQHLATAKACAVSALRPGDLVLGADQVLALGNQHFTKPVDRAAARQTLEQLSGQTHVLHSAFAIARDGELLASDVAEARLTMRTLGPAFVEAYLDIEGDAVLSSVGAYRLEGLGVHLFTAIAGDHATILGLPLLPLLAALRRLGHLLG